MDLITKFMEIPVIPLILEMWLSHNQMMMTAAPMVCGICCFLYTPPGALWMSVDIAV
jgi:hypothetical protein